jgi:hypothetical protein
MPMKPEEKAWQQLPDGIEAEPAGGGTVYRWRVLPDSPGLIIFFSVLALLVLFLGLLGFFLLFGAVSDWVGVLEKQFKDYGDFGILLIGIALIVLLVKTWNFFATILFARCRLSLGPTEFDYQVFLFGRKVRSKSFHLPAADIISLALKDVTRKGLELQRRQGKPFYLLLQRFSEAELMKIKKRFLQDLGREKP